MTAAEVDESVAAALLDRFEDVGLIDDAAYARAIVRTRFAERHLARRAIAQELSRKGISAEHALEALEQIGPDDEQVAAEHLVRVRLRRTEGLPAEVRTRRALAALVRKGYAPGVALASIRAALATEADDGLHSGDGVLDGDDGFAGL